MNKYLYWYLINVNKKENFQVKLLFFVCLDIFNFVMLDKCIFLNLRLIQLFILYSLMDGENEYIILRDSMVYF